MAKSSLFRGPKQFLTEEDGTTAVEYAVMISLILAFCMGSFFAMSQATDDSFNETGEKLQNAFDN